MKNWKSALKNGLAIGLLAASSSGWGQSMSFGDSDCGQWVANPEGRKSWLMGYLSGMNSATADPTKNIDHLKKLKSAQQAYLWVDKYCRENPLKNVSDGGIALFIELIKK